MDGISALMHCNRAESVKNSIDKDTLRTIVARSSGATVVGFARAGKVGKDAVSRYRSWIADGCHADMCYLERYDEVRHNPRLLLSGATTIIMTAFSYANPKAVVAMEENGAPLIAEYALGQDYHDVLKRRLEIAASELKERFGGETRVCVDTAPLRERYWAQQAGLGYIGVNNYLIVPGQGAHFVLGAILWTGAPADGFDEPCNMSCGECGECARSCPTGALSESGRLDARRCLSFLTIESREPLPEGIDAGRRLYGCDTCRRVCPHQRTVVERTAIEEFVARQEVVSLTAEDWREMPAERFRELFRHSAVWRGRHAIAHRYGIKENKK